MNIRSWMGSAAVMGLLLAGPALALETRGVEEALGFDAEKTKVGLDVRLGLGGMTGGLADQTGTGPLLGIAAGAQPWRALGLELGYEGQRLPLNEDLVGEGQALYRHNLGALAKAGPRINERWRPFVGAGVGLSYIDVTDGADPVYDNDFVTEVPLAVGVDYNLGNIFAGARATYRLMYGEGFAEEVTPEGTEGNLFNASLTLGGRF